MTAETSSPKWLLYTGLTICLLWKVIFIVELQSKTICQIIIFVLVDRYVYYVKLHLYKVIYTIELFLKKFEVVLN